MTQAVRLARLVPIGAALLLAGCAGSPPVHAQADTAARRSNVVPPSISMVSAEATAAPGSHIVLAARPRGGEAMLFTVDWKAESGSVQPLQRKADGSYEAEYTAPPKPGTDRVTATIREYPAASATTLVRVTAR